MHKAEPLSLRLLRKEPDVGSEEYTMLMIP